MDYRNENKFINKFTLTMLIITLAAAILLSSCSKKTEYIEYTDVHRSIEIGFKSNEVELMGIESTTLPDFPFDLVVEKDNYNMIAIAESGQELSSWTQSLEESYTFSATGKVSFNVSKEVDYTIPKRTYSLIGYDYVNEFETSSVITMVNAQYAGIAVFSDNVSSVTIDGLNMYSVVVQGGQYHYSFVKPGQGYVIDIVDNQHNSHKVTITEDQLKANDMARIFVSSRNVNGSFQIVIDWDYTDIVAN